MSFNLIDALVALVIVLGAVGGWYSGFILATLELLALVASAAAAFFGHGVVADWVETWWPANSVWVEPLSFLAVFAIVYLLLGMLITVIVRAVPRRAHGHRVNRFLGIAPGTVNGAIYAALVSVLLVAMPVGARVSEMIRDSELAQWLSAPVASAEAVLGPIFDPAIRRTLRAMTIPPDSEASIPLRFQVANARQRPDLEASMLELVNAERVHRGLGPLAADPVIGQVALAHDRDMFARGYFSHHTPEGRTLEDRLRQAQVRYLVAGENLAYARTLPQAHQGLMNSPGHRKNILQPQFGRVGIAILDAGPYGLMVTQNFRN